MSDLAEFLLARIAEDEAAARAVLDYLPDHYEAEWGLPEKATVDPGGVETWFGVGTFELAAHIARWDPARVLAECEAKRRLVEEARDAHRAEVSIRETFADFPDDTRARVERATYSARAGVWYEALCLLALPYADHPDYREDWKP